MKRRDLGGAAGWRRRIAEWQRSGLGARAFAAREGVSEQGLYRWRKKLALADSGGATKATRSTRPRPERVGNTRRKRSRAKRSETSAMQAFELVELTQDRTGAPGRTWAFEIVLGSGPIVRVPSDFDPEALRRLVFTLEQG